jgi:IS30 family transposase
MQSYHHFTLTERESLRISIAEGKGIRQIAKELGRSPSSISREISRNKNKDGSYHPWRATTLYIIRRKESRRRLILESNADMRQCVLDGLAKFWSPEIIAQRWKMENPNGKLSHHTIYSAIKNNRLEGISKKTHLRRKGRRKNSHQSATIHPEHSIHDRPDIIEQRERLGDWEGDTVYGAIGKGLLVTCVDRKSRYLAASLLNSRAVNETKEAVIQALEGLDVKSLTLDNGSEFAAFKELEQELEAPIYFADPHSPWQRGSNENMNDLIRFFFPKGTNFHLVDQNVLDSVLSLINNRPRKCLGWLSPIEFLSKCCT